MCACEFLGFKAYNAVFYLNLRAQGFKTLYVLVNRPKSNITAAGVCHGHLPETGKKGPQEVVRSPKFLNLAIGNMRVAQAGGYNLHGAAFVHLHLCAHFFYYFL